MSMDQWTHGYDSLNAALNKFGSKKSMSAEDLLKVAEVEALLAIGQQLSAIRHQGINPEFDGSLID